MNAMSSQPSRHQVSLPYPSVALPPLSSPSHPGSSILITSGSEVSLTAESHAFRRRLISIDVLPDEILLATFHFYVDEALEEVQLPVMINGIEAWQSLVHVCRRWRSVVFGSPRRLNLRLCYTPKTPARGMLVWPELPLVICNDIISSYMDKLTALLESEHSRDRVSQIALILTSLQVDEVSRAMQKPFPELTHLDLHTSYGIMPTLPDSFLGGSAPRIQLFWLHGILFPALPNLLLTATRLVDLRLCNIPHSEHFPLEAIVIALSTLTRLRFLELGFRSSLSRPARAGRSPPSSTRSVLPALVYFYFKGVNEYLEDIVARIDTPLLGLLSIDLFNQTVFDTPNIIQFITRTPRLKAFEKARVSFGPLGGMVDLFSHTTSGYGEVLVSIECSELDSQVSSLGQICTSCLPPLSTLEDLYIFRAPIYESRWQDNIESTLWLQLLHAFATVKNLHLSEDFASLVVPALQELVEGRATEVLPTLQNIFLEGLLPCGPVQEGIGQFVATRTAASHPIAVSRWETSHRDKASRFRFKGGKRAIINTI